MVVHAVWQAVSKMTRAIWTQVSSLARSHRDTDWGSAFSTLRSELSRSIHTTENSLIHALHDTKSQLLHPSKSEVMPAQKTLLEFSCVIAKAKGKETQMPEDEKVTLGDNTDKAGRCIHLVSLPNGVPDASRAADGKRSAC